MASKRRGSSGFRTPGGTLGTLLRSALEQASGVRDVLERGAREGRKRLDNYRSDQRRTEALAELGEVVLDLVRRGEIDPAELPEAHDALHELEAIDGENYHAHDHDHDHDHAHGHAHPPERARFDDRGDGTVSSGRWSPPKPSKPGAAVWRPPGAHAHADDHTALETPAAPAPPPRRGGITFGADDDDSDLAEYMHPDDVPPKSE